MTSRYLIDIENRKSKIIHVYRNGDKYNRAALVLLRPIEQQKLERIFKAIEEKLTLPYNKPIRKIYTLNGREIDDPIMVKDQKYYVVGSSENFISTRYGSIYKWAIIGPVRWSKFTDVFYEPPEHDDLSTGHKILYQWKNNTTNSTRFPSKMTKSMSAYPSDRKRTKTSKIMTLSMEQSKRPISEPSDDMKAVNKDINGENGYLINSSGDVSVTSPKIVSSQNLRSMDQFLNDSLKMYQLKDNSVNREHDKTDQPEKDLSKSEERSDYKNDNTKNDEIVSLTNNNENQLENEFENSENLKTDKNFPENNSNEKEQEILYENVEENLENVNEDEHEISNKHENYESENDIDLQETNENSNIPNNDNENEILEDSVLENDESQLKDHINELDLDKSNLQRMDMNEISEENTNDDNYELNEKLNSHDISVQNDEEDDVFKNENPVDTDVFKNEEILNIENSKDPFVDDDIHKEDEISSDFQLKDFKVDETEEVHDIEQIDSTDNNENQYDDSVKIDSKMDKPYQTNEYLNSRNYENTTEELLEIVKINDPNKSDDDNDNSMKNESELNFSQEESDSQNLEKSFKKDNDYIKNENNKQEQHKSEENNYMNNYDNLVSPSTEKNNEIFNDEVIEHNNFDESDLIDSMKFENHRTSPNDIINNIQIPKFTGDYLDQQDNKSENDLLLNLEKNEEVINHHESLKSKDENEFIETLAKSKQEDYENIKQENENTFDLKDEQHIDLIGNSMADIKDSFAINNEDEEKDNQNNINYKNNKEAEFILKNFESDLSADINDDNVNKSMSENISNEKEPSYSENEIEADESDPDLESMAETDKNIGKFKEKEIDSETSSDKFLNNERSEKGGNDSNYENNSVNCGEKDVNSVSTDQHLRKSNELKSEKYDNSDFEVEEEDQDLSSKLDYAVSEPDSEKETLDNKIRELSSKDNNEISESASENETSNINHEELNSNSKQNLKENVNLRTDSNIDLKEQYNRIDLKWTDPSDNVEEKNTSYPDLSDNEDHRINENTDNLEQYNRIDLKLEEPFNCINDVNKLLTDVSDNESQQIYKNNEKSNDEDHLEQYNRIDFKIEDPVNYLHERKKSLSDVSDNENLEIHEDDKISNVTNNLEQYNQINSEEKETSDCTDENNKSLLDISENDKEEDKHIENYKLHKNHNENERDEVSEDLSQLDDQEFEKNNAAKIIQKNFRGHLVRKELIPDFKHMDTEGDIESEGEQNRSYDQQDSEDDENDPDVNFSLMKDATNDLNTDEIMDEHSQLENIYPDDAFVFNNKP